MPRIQDRPELRDALKTEAGRQDPERYPTSVTDCIYCPGKAAGKEWPEFIWPFNAKLERGSGVESVFRPYLPSIGFPTEVPPKASLDGIEGHADALSPEALGEVKSTDFGDTHASLQDHHLIQAKAYCKLYDRTKVFFITLFNKANQGFGEIVIKEITFSMSEINSTWLWLKARAKVVERARAWAKEGPPRMIPPAFRQPKEPWECFTSKGVPSCQMLRAGLCEGIKNVKRRP